ncbi:hypothetical protein ABL78_3056 [Leptomonas seymouri]|uniref:PH-like domain-containing protein n=1 Tax=Leptomonas seymouri TaxID=5684 RepID=A0A0N0P6N7_LEPSE|nr:hypothetical protein ABL78_3056 [Leptomonas seymouri]|eukprot:KPI87829.1 hypothetical protein ABL78_3056 [Leptomonas seymouri]
MSALEVLLNSPTDGIVECPSIGPEEVQLVSLNLEIIFNKCLYCVRVNLPLPLEVLLSVVGDAGEVQPDKVCTGLLHAAEEGTCADLFCELASNLLSRKAAGFRLQFDVESLFKVMQLFCCSSALKDRLGGSLGEVLLGYMTDSEMHADDYRVHRNCCSALISLLRGSQVNKSRFGPDCAVIAACLENSSDFFFQMQCVEVLYRLYKHNSRSLTDLQAPASTAASISPYLLRGIEELPNDSTLLLSIHQLLDNYNRDAHPDRIVAFPVLRIQVEGVEVSRATTLYFSPRLLVVLLPGGAGGYLTIPYEHVRSVKLSKDHRLELRLYIIPAKLALIMSLEEGEGRDKLTVSMTRATMHELRTSVVHQWVAERKRNAPRRTVQQVRPRAPPSHSASASRRAQGAREPGAATAAGAHGPSPPGSGRTRSSSRHGIEERSVNLDRHRDKDTSSGFLHAGPGMQGAGNPSRSGSSSHRDRTLSAIGTGAEEESFLSEVHRAASVKAVRYREEQQEHVQRAVDAVKRELEDLRRWSVRERDHYEANFREDMEVVRRSEAVLKESAAECVQALNAELDDVQALGALLKAEVDKLRERLAKSLGKSEGVEEAFLVRIKQSVDTRMREMEDTLLTMDPSSSASAAGTSLEGVVQYITQQMQLISSGKLTPGEPQRESGPPRATKSRRLN